MIAVNFEQCMRQIYFACINTLHVFTDLWHLYLFMNLRKIISFSYFRVQDRVVHPLRWLRILLKLRTEASEC